MRWPNGKKHDYASIDPHGAKLRVTDQTVAHWEKGEATIPGVADQMLRVLFLASDCAQPEGSKVLNHLLKMLNDLRERDEEEHSAPIRLRHAKKGEPEKARRELARSDDLRNGDSQRGANQIRHHELEHA
jgi:hypothetical protein